MDGTRMGRAYLPFAAEAEKITPASHDHALDACVSFSHPCQ